MSWEAGQFCKALKGLEFITGTRNVHALGCFSQHGNIQKFLKWNSIDCVDIFFLLLLRPVHLLGRISMQHSQSCHNHTKHSVSHLIEKIMQLCHVSHQFIMTSKDNFEIQRSEHFFFSEGKNHPHGTSNASQRKNFPHFGVRNLLLLNLSSKLQAFQTNFTCAVKLSFFILWFPIQL